MSMQTLEKACPLCSGDVKGNNHDRYYCKKCDVLFDYHHLLRPEAGEGLAAEVKIESVPPAKQANTPRKVGFVTSRHSGKYHRLGCRYIDQIMPENLAQFDTAREAENKGYKPCVCVK